MLGIIFVGDLKYCPYLEHYLSVLEQEKMPYDVLFWNRENKPLVLKDNYYSYNEYSELNLKPNRKLTSFINYRKWLLRMMKRKKYSKLILLSTLSAMIIADKILCDYKRKYFYDIRDYSYEQNKIFFLIESLIVKRSFATSISSEGFLNFLPRYQKYIFCHNVIHNDFKYRKNFKKKKYGEVLNLVWNGSLRYFEHQKSIIEKLKDDSRFKLIYHGTGPDFNDYVKYCNENNISNVFLTGAYDNKEKHILLGEADILNNSYNMDLGYEVKYAVSNKFYDGLIFGIPQLVEKESFKQEKVIRCQVGINLATDDKAFADKLYDYYFSINQDEFNLFCEKEIKQVLIEDELFIDKISKFVKAR